MSANELIMGIDLGTTFSSVALLENGQPRILEDERGEKLVPSVVGVDAAGSLMVGRDARNQAVAFPERTVRSIKRRMGEDCRIRLGEREYSPPEISSLILGRLAQIASSRLGHPVKKAVITVPAYFSDAQRQATRHAGEIAGLEVVRVLNEPTAAGLAYGLKKDPGKRVLVYDFGGGTFDCSVLEMQEGVIEVRASHGDTHLGGDDIDQALVDHLARRFLDDHGEDLKEDRRALARLFRAAERAKVVLSSHPFVTVQEEFLVDRAGQALHLVTEVSRHELEELIEPLIERTIVCVRKTLADAHLEPSQLDQVLLVGGSSRIPLVHHRLSEELRIEPVMKVNPDECVALGAACEAALMGGHEVGAVLVDICAHSLGMRVVGMHRGLYVDNVYSVIIPRNTPIPTSRSDVYATCVPNQKVVEVEVFQGEEPLVDQNTRIGSFEFREITRGPEGQPIVVQFDYDLDGIVHVTATDKGSGRTLSSTMRDPRQEARAQSSPESRELPPLPPAPSGRRALQERGRHLAQECSDPVLRVRLLELLERLEKLEAQATQSDIT
ncbi:MAG: Hsp70 family protein, partial [Candidatus Riflebacteria bacterium]|nr:Hsp70 family protein [Candidatus Riflebacteria bacterium]